MKFRLPALLATFTLLFSLSGQAAEYSPGNGYTLLETPVAVMADGKVHVEEAFWYGCPHCYDLEGSITAWRKTLSSDVEFSGVPAQFGRAWVAHAQLYFTAEALGVLDIVNEPIFNAIHRQNKRLLTQKEQRDFLVTYAKVSAEDFDKAYKSFTVKSRMAQANKRIEAFGINGVPAFIVQGKYVVDAASAKGQNNIIKVVNYLVQKERQALAN